MVVIGLHVIIKLILKNLTSTMLQKNLTITKNLNLPVLYDIIF